MPEMGRTFAGPAGCEGEGFDTFYYRFDVDFVVFDQQTNGRPVIFDITSMCRICRSWAMFGWAIFGSRSASTG